MSDFEEFLAKVLSPIQAEGREGRSGTGRAAPKDGGSSAVEVVPDSELERRYVEVMNALLLDANERGALNVFADVVAWKLSMVAHGCGPRACGDILRRFGAHLMAIAEAEEAQVELNKAKDGGLRPN